MIITLTMPQFGESITSTRLVRWLKKEGDSLKELEPLVEMETEKSLFAYECPFQGKLLKVLKGDDQEVPVGTDIAQFEVSDQNAKKYLSLGIGKVSGTVEVEKVTSIQQGLSPLIRSLAKENKISLEEVSKLQGSGPGGRVSKEDFQKYLQAKGPGFSAKEGVTVIPLTPIRARIAENMTLSKSKIPHAGCSLDVDLFSIESYRKSQPRARSYLVFAAMAVLRSLKKYPILNSSWKEEGGKSWMEQYDFIHLGMAVATEHGLMVPIIRNAHTMTFSELSQEMERLIEGARRRNLTVPEITGGTFSINNAGALGTMRSLQVIPYPQAAILAVNRVVQRPWVVGGKIEIRPIVSLDLAFDHRIIDGDIAVRFLVDVANDLEKFSF